MPDDILACAMPRLHTVPTLFLHRCAVISPLVVSPRSFHRCTCRVCAAGATPLLWEPWAPTPPVTDVLSTALRVFDYDERGLPKPTAADRNLRRRAPLMLCNTILFMNAALLAHKKAFCPEGFNSTRTLILRDL